MKDLSQNFYPAPKPSFEKRPKKKKKVQRMKGRRVPTQKERGAISKKSGNKALEVYNHQCGGCGYGGEALELHHILFRSQGGRGQWRNIVPLCRRCHDACHGKFQNESDASVLEEWDAMFKRLHEAKYGPHFGSDVWDLFSKGLVPNTTPEAYERFMEQEETNAR